MRFKGKYAAYESESAMCSNPKRLDAEFRMFRPQVSVCPDAPPIFECRTKLKTRRFKISPGSCTILTPPNDSTKLTIHFKQPKMYLLISSIDPSDQSAVKFLVEREAMGMHKAEKEKADKLLHTPYGSSASAVLKPKPKKMVLVEQEATTNFRRREKFDNTLVSLTLKNAPLRLDGRIFVLENLQELLLENVCLNQPHNCSILTNLCRLSNLKKLSLADNAIEELPEEVLDAFPASLENLILRGNKLTILPRQLGRLRLLFHLDVSNNKLKFLNEDVFAHRLLTLRLQQNCFQWLPFTLFYGHRYDQLYLSENPVLFNERFLKTQQTELNQLPEEVPDLQAMALAKVFNSSKKLVQHVVRTLPPPVRVLHDDLHLCFMCLKYVPHYGRLNLKLGRFDFRNFSSEVSYHHNDFMINCFAFVCLSCLPKVNRQKLFCF